MEELQDELLIQLQKLIDHLLKYEENTWANHFIRTQKLIDHGDRRGLDFLVKMRGGMGSFSDLIICQMNAHKIEKQEETFANEELMRLGNTVITSADKLNRQLNKR